MLAHQPLAMLVQPWDIINVPATKCGQITLVSNDMHDCMSHKKRAFSETILGDRLHANKHYNKIHHKQVNITFNKINNA